MVLHCTVLYCRVDYSPQTHEHRSEAGSKSMEIKRARGRWTTTDNNRARRRLGAIQIEIRDAMGTGKEGREDMDWESAGNAVAASAIRTPPPEDMEQGTP